VTIRAAELAERVRPNLRTHDRFGNRIDESSSIRPITN